MKQENQKQNENHKLNELMSDTKATFVFTKILHLGLMLTDDMEICEPLTDFLEEMDELLVKALAGKFDLSGVLAMLDDGHEDEALGELARCAQEQDRYGFLCHVEAPEVTRLSDGSKAIHMGIRALRWFYGETLQEVIEQADAWAFAQEKEGPIGRLVEVPEGGEEDEDDDEDDDE